jgi:antibiotic biosynthesis monooxygenase (ABM) superfamily enzyme
MTLLNIAVLFSVYLALAILMWFNDAPIEAILLWGGTLAILLSYYVLIPLIKLLLRIIDRWRTLVSRGE